MRFLAVFFIVLGQLVVADGVSAEWTLRRASEPAPGQSACRLESERISIPDGYQNSQVQVVIDSRSVRIRSASPLDASFSDIGVQIDEQPMLVAEHVLKEKNAVFEAQYQNLVKLLKNGKVLHLQMRFWPTWPATSSFKEALSLDGFSKAYDEMIGCK